MGSSRENSRQNFDKEIKKIMKLNIGAGYTRIIGYASVDIDEKTGADYICDCRDLKIFEKETIDEIFTSHLLEHFNKKDVFIVLREFYRVLKKEGKLTIIVPDAEAVVQDYSNGAANLCCLENVLLGSDPEATNYMGHKIFFNLERLARFLTITGFIDIEIERGPRRYELKGVARK